jgi:hypothetical protein
VVTAEKDDDFALSDQLELQVEPQPGISTTLQESAAVLRGSVFTDRGVYSSGRKYTSRRFFERHTGGHANPSAGHRTRRARSRQRAA